VTAQGWASEAAGTGLPVTVIPVEPADTGDIVQVLQTAPGVALSRNGGNGGFTGLRLRGSEAEQVLVLVDGVRVADPAAPANGFDFGNLLPANIEQVEILRGPNSVVWGSQAIAGVVAITSRELDGVLGVVEYGGADTIRANADAGVSEDWGSLTVSAAFHDEQGISTAAGGAEPDGLHHWQVGAKGEVRLVESLAAKLFVRHAEARLDADGFPPPNYMLADTAEYQLSEQTLLRTGLEFTGQRLDLSGFVWLADTSRENFDPDLGTAPTYTTAGLNRGVEARGRWDVSEAVQLRFGAEHEASRFESLFDARKHTSASAAYGQAGVTSGPFLANVGLRMTDHADFGSAWTFGMDGGVELPFGRLRASYGEGFKAPSLFQLHSDYGNVLLVPERSRSIDAGVEFDLVEQVTVSLSAFRRNSRNLVAFISCFGSTEDVCDNRPFGTYINVGLARAQGIEVEWSAELTPGLTLQGNYSHVEATNRTAGDPLFGNHLPRRPRHAVNLGFDWQAIERIKLGADLRVVPASYDDPANAARLDAYTTVNLHAAFDLTDELQLYGRVENAFDHTYQTAAGYGAYGREAYVGIRAEW
jgi:vitamin B12 transporter